MGLLGFIKAAKQYVKSTAPNLYQVTPLLYRSAQPSLSDLKRYKRRYGIEVILNLRETDQSKERSEAESLGLRFVHIPMFDDSVPSDKDIRRALDVMRSGRVVLVNCKGGRHRTGFMVAIFRVVVQKWSKEKAWKECEDIAWYDAFGHKPLRLRFEQFNPEEFK